MTRRSRLAILSPQLSPQILAAAQRADPTIEMSIRQVEPPQAWASQERHLT